MDIKDIDQFGKYCAENANREHFSDDLQFTESIANTAVLMEKSYGGHGQTVADFIRLAIDRTLSEDKTLQQHTYETMEEIMTRFWKHREDAARWFANHTVIVQIAS